MSAVACVGSCNAMIRVGSNGQKKAINRHKKITLRGFFCRKSRLKVVIYLLLSIFSIWFIIKIDCELLFSSGRHINCFCEWGAKFAAPVFVLDIGLVLYVFLPICIMFM